MVLKFHTAWDTLDWKSRLLQRVEGGTTTNYTWNGWSLIKEIKTGAISETTDYLIPANAFERGGEWFYMHGDALSSTQLVTDENGDQAARFIFGAWGEELYASESVPGILENRFIGGLGCRKDATTDLIYMRHRWYDPALQRFISRDPIGLMGGTNLYKYAQNNPVNFVDPQGLGPCEVAREACLALARTMYELVTLVGREAIGLMADALLAANAEAYLTAKEIMDEFDEYERLPADAAYAAAQATCEASYSTCRSIEDCEKRLLN